MNPADIETVAVVGNGPSALDYPLGRRIDDCDKVVRINNYRLSAQWTKYIGSQTDIFASNLYTRDVKKTRAELVSDGVTQIWATIPKGTRFSHWDSDWQAAELQYRGFPIASIDWRSFVTLNAHSGKGGELLYAAACSLGGLGFRFVGGLMSPPTSGLVAILKAIELRPKTIMLTGFDFFTAVHSHYFDDTEPPKKTHHRFNREPAVLARLIRDNPQTLFELAIPASIVEAGFTELANVRVLR